MFTERALAGDLRTERLDAEFYNPVHVRNARKVEALHGDTLLALCSRILDHSFLTIRTGDYQESGIPFVRVKNLKGITLDEEFVFISEEANQRESQTICTPGDLLFAKTGKIAACPVPRHLGFVNTSQDVMVATVNEGTDSYYVAAYLNCKHGALYQDRYVQGPVQPHLSLGNLKQIYVPRFHDDARKYIGDKVRHAERLQKRARCFQDEIDKLVTSDSIREALRTPESLTNCLSSSEVNHRLDAKYYGLRALRVYKACLCGEGARLAELEPGVTNGFEYRQFVTAGREYVTVSEVSTGRVDLTNAPRIPIDIDIPAKGRMSPFCVVVVRGGSVGYAAKAHQDDCHAVVSSDLIRLEFDDEETAAAVGLFLNSAAGQCLQHKAAYGGVMPKLGQDELLEIPIPQTVLEHRSDLLNLFNVRETCFRCGQRLASAAKLLVEELIEGRIAEVDLLAAQQAIKRGDQSLDRTILSRLTAAGIDVTGKPPLFPDLDALFTATEESQRTDTGNGGAA